LTGLHMYMYVCPGTNMILYGLSNEVISPHTQQKRVNRL
jgi:hypothetical protein